MAYLMRQMEHDPPFEDAEKQEKLFPTIASLVSHSRVLTLIDFPIKVSRDVEIPLSRSLGRPSLIVDATFPNGTKERQALIKLGIVALRRDIR